MSLTEGANLDQKSRKDQFWVDAAIDTMRGLTQRRIQRRLQNLDLDSKDFQRIWTSKAEIAKRVASGVEGTSTTSSTDPECSLGNYWCTLLTDAGISPEDQSKVTKDDQGLWYYNHQSTKVGTGAHNATCDSAVVFCAGGLTFGYGGEQTIAVKAAIDNGGVHPNWYEYCNPAYTDTVQRQQADLVDKKVEYITENGGSVCVLIPMTQSEVFCRDDPTECAELTKQFAAERATEIADATTNDDASTCAVHTEESPCNSEVGCGFCSACEGTKCLTCVHLTSTDCVAASTCQATLYQGCVRN